MPREGPGGYPHYDDDEDEDDEANDDDDEEEDDVDDDDNYDDDGDRLWEGPKGTQKDGANDDDEGGAPGGGGTYTQVDGVVIMTNANDGIDDPSQVYYIPT